MARKRRVLSVASECAPLIKTGGLADVVGALPAALAPHGWSSRVLLPGYPSVMARMPRSRRVWRTDDLFGGPAAVRDTTIDGFDVMLLDAPHLFDRPGGPYESFEDSHVRFAALSWVASRIAIEGLASGWRPDLVHAHDWQAGLAPSYLKYAASEVPSVLTIHNIAFQGIFGADQLDRLKLPTWDFHPDALEYYGNVSALKAGIVHATRVTTVSPTYAAELTTPEFGFGLEGVVAMRAARGEMHGILNGIDTSIWDPSRDPMTQPFDADALAGKAAAREALLEEFGLDEPAGPLAVVVTRLTHQKGIDLLLEALPPFVDAGGAVAILGSGDHHYEQALLALRSPRVGVRLGYDEPLSHRMYAGGDLVLVPSRFEPCGLTQMYGLRYGALPVVASTGGLRDTVDDGRTGFVFDDISSAGLSAVLARAAAAFGSAPEFARMRREAMAEPVDWGTSAAEYAALFDSLL
ncbi:glycogen synthase [Microbacterium nanhaiense]|uniref:Glycogen synthase n=1 Tax=Microbacterium nanhaiense TaxID=1301026 RepID=A0ABQ2N3G2_9MICO|nr:glycogen synthase GlgA [Microbacterium nanhaiense]GGO67007.1 glycogen synthase [Microbacterium nanhaiense]